MQTFWKKKMLKKDEQCIMFLEFVIYMIFLLSMIFISKIGNVKHKLTWICKLSYYVSFMSH